MHFASYDVQRRLATGGMAEVFLCRATSSEGLERPAVIKRILPEFARDETFLATFMNEAHLASCLRHPSIVQVFDLGRMGETYFLSMEYVRGFDLATIINLSVRNKEQIPLLVVLTIWLDMLEGLDFAHHATDLSGKWLGIVHRDVTPSNVMVSLDGQAKMLDFGIAKATARDNNLTKQGTLKGKWSYMAPEQVVGATVDARTDIFACSLTIYEALCGKNPNRCENTYESLLKIAQRDVPDVRQHRADVPEQIAELLKLGLQRNVDERAQRCRDIARGLRNAMTALALTPSAQAVRNYIRSREEALSTVAQSWLNHKSGSDITGQSLLLQRTRTITMPHLVGEGEFAPEICEAEITNIDGARSAVRRGNSQIVPPPIQPAVLPSAKLSKRRLALIAASVATLLSMLGLLMWRFEPELPVLPAQLPTLSKGTTELRIETDPPGAKVLLSRPEEPGFIMLTGDTPLITNDVLPDTTYDYKIISKARRIERGTIHTRNGEQVVVKVSLRQE